VRFHMCIAWLTLVRLFLCHFSNMHMVTRQA
jgi:hypothetical protein